MRRVRPDQWTESFHTADRDRVATVIQFACQQRRLPLERSCTRRSVVMTTAACPCGGWCWARYVSTAATGPKALPRQEAYPRGALRLDVRAAVRCWHGASSHRARSAAGTFPPCVPPAPWEPLPVIGEPWSTPSSSGPQNVPAGRMGTSPPVGFFAIDEELLVEAADDVPGRPG